MSCLDEIGWRNGSGFWVQGSGFWVQGSRFWVQGSRFWVQGSGFKVQGSGFKVEKLPNSPWQLAKSRSGINSVPAVG
jgi:hypothetical protein